MSERDQVVSSPTGCVSTGAEVAAFLQKAAAIPQPRSGRRLIFAMDATASREPTWGRACAIQGEMFGAAAALGGILVQLVYYRGQECRASTWVRDAASLQRLMARVSCQGGQTQIGRVLGHVLRVARNERVGAVVFVGDCVEEPVDSLCAQAGELGLLGVPVFAFHEGFDARARVALQQISALSGGAFCRFDTGSADQLRHLLGAVAAYVAGGWPALEAYRHGKSGPVALLRHRIDPG